MDRPLMGIGLMLLAIACFSGMDAILKHFSDRLPLAQIMLFRYGLGILPIVGIALARGGLSRLRPQRLWVHIARMLCASLALACFITALRTLSLTNATTVFFAGPIFVTVLSVLLLREPLTRVRVAAIGLGLLGVLVAMRPDQEIFRPASGLVAVGALGYACAQVLARRYAASETGEALSFSVNVGAAGIVAIFAPFVWQALEIHDVLLLLGMGTLGGFALFFMTEAMRIASPPLLGPFEYTAVVWSALIEWTVWRLWPDIYTGIGCVLISIGGLYLLREETDRKKDR